MTKLSVTDLSRDLRDAIVQLETTEGLEKVGIVTRVGDGVAAVRGLAQSPDQRPQVSACGGDAGEQPAAHQGTQGRVVWRSALPWLEVPQP